MIHTRMRLLKATVAVIALLALATAAYLQHPLFGQLPQGVFRHQMDSPMLTTNQSEWSMWMETRFGKKGQPGPPGAHSPATQATPRLGPTFT